MILQVLVILGSLSLLSGIVVIASCAVTGVQRVADRSSAIPAHYELLP